MDRIIIYDLNEDFIERITEFLCSNFVKDGNDLSRIACVFAGKRPGLFLKRAISKKLKRSFLPPKIFSIDEFVDYTISKNKVVSRISELESAFIIYKLVKEHFPNLLIGKDKFSDFLPWAKEIVSFIDQLDLENIDNEKLSHIEKNAEIGYDVPPSINQLLTDISRLRQFYHQELEKNNIYSRGRLYIFALKVVKEERWDEFDTIIFCNFFYLHSTERKIFLDIYNKGKGIFVFQGSREEWSVLNDFFKDLGDKPNIKNSRAYKGKFPHIYFYQGYDMHSQICAVQSILRERISSKDNTVIVVPRAEIVSPLLGLLSPIIDDFNVSLGYPLKNTSLYVLFNFLHKAEEGKKYNRYYTKDYLNILKHPLVKNLKILGEPSITRVLVHKIEELLQGKIESSLGGSIFLSLEEIEGEEQVYSLTLETLANMDINISRDECKNVLREIHFLFFKSWEGVRTFSSFSLVLDNLLRVLLGKSMFAQFPINLKVLERIYFIKDEFNSLSFKDEKFEILQLWEIFHGRIEGEVIPFVGSPLKGMQILGILETRSLNFDNVIIMDMNESVFPKLKVYEPFVPREVMVSLGLNRLEKEEEIQRYHFMRLISSAKNVYLVYEENSQKEKSRFIEQILWEKQREMRKLDIVDIGKIYFPVQIVNQKLTVIEKSPKVVDFLREHIYSSTALNTYLTCPLRFYYQYVLGLEKEEELLDEPEASHIGVFIHELLEEGFLPFKWRKPLIDNKFRKNFFKMMEEKFNNELARRMKSDAYLLKEVIVNRLNKFLDNEVKRNVQRIISLEEKRSGSISFNGKEIIFTYTVDRIDEFSDGSIVIIDYKTGSSELLPKRLANLEGMKLDRESIYENIRSFQLPIYYYFISQEFSSVNVNAELYNLRTLERKVFISKEDYPHRDRVMNICLRALEAIFSELWDLNVPFHPTEDKRRCDSCEFILLCR
ncbi:MAG: PD-(D/E)XK nuclease family protein [Candidatus Omnitrophica bacterium]|nr:PD-(D/E)XK nuclease family protein [Candidatus Omnitrophota bacterium]